MTKHDYCPFCSTLTTLHQLRNGDWACKDGRPGFTCYDFWEKQLQNPMPITIKDF